MVINRPKTETPHLEYTKNAVDTFLYTIRILLHIRLDQPGEGWDRSRSFPELRGEEEREECHVLGGDRPVLKLQHQRQYLKVKIVRNFSGNFFTSPGRINLSGIFINRHFKIGNLVL